MKERLIQFLKEDGLTIAVVLALAIAYIVLRTPGDDFDSLAALEARLTDGRPTVIELYSNTCSICLISKPRVDQLARDISPQADVLRLNVKDGVGRELAYHWQVAGVPTFFTRCCQVLLIRRALLRVPAPAAVDPFGKGPGVLAFPGEPFRGADRAAPRAAR